MLSVVSGSTCLLSQEAPATHTGARSLSLDRALTLGTLVFGSFWYGRRSLALLTQIPFLPFSASAVDALNIYDFTSVRPNG